MERDNSPDPGQYDGHLKQFGADVVRKVDMGSKYKFVPKEGPGPGEYDSNNHPVLARSRSAKISPIKKKLNRIVDHSPDPGQYDSHLRPFGADVVRRVDMGSKYEFKPN